MRWNISEKHPNVRQAVRTLLSIVGVFCLSASAARAHEVYVLSPSQIAAGFASDHPLTLSALNNPHNVSIFFWVTAGVMLLFAGAVIFRLSRSGERFYNKLGTLNQWGPLFVRGAIAASFFYSALTWSFLGPELSLRAMPLAIVMRAILFAASAMFLLGVGVEVAAAVSLALFFIGGYVFGWYLLTYVNYLGEIIVLLLFGSRRLSFDALWRGSLKRFPRLSPYETVIVRIGYGAALLYAAITVKVLHPILTIDVVNQYHLTQFHWLFPSDPSLVVLGAAIAEIAIGFFILVGFETQLTVFISLIYITLSLMYFREAVWPHLMLYGISLNLIFNRERGSVGSWLLAQGIRLRSRLFKTHTA